MTHSHLPDPDATPGLRPADDAGDLARILELAPSPAFVVHTGRLARNLAVLDEVQRRTGAKILLALKGFAMWHLFPQIRAVLHGACASGVIEARLAREEFGREVHTYAPAFSDEDLREILTLTDHLVFNSFSQWRRHRPQVEACGRRIECGLRLNPEHSTAAVPIYDPCAPGSRLGLRRQDFAGESLEGLSGFHFHTLCEQNSDALEATLDAVEERFGDLFRSHRPRWLNFGGGHHITRPDYDLDRLCRLLRRTRERHGVQVYLEPGEAVALETGFLVATVLDVLQRDQPIAILDTSATCHMPDVLEMPYRPRLEGAAEPGVLPHTYRLGGLSCLAGDVIGDYSFARPLRAGDRLLFHDMGHYSMVKTTTFNGVRLPSLAVYEPADGQVRVLRRFGYEDYKMRLS